LASDENFQKMHLFEFGGKLLLAGVSGGFAVKGAAKTPTSGGVSVLVMV
jgi:hypothetical protein